VIAAAGAGLTVAVVSLVGGRTLAACLNSLLSGGVAILVVGSGQSVAATRAIADRHGARLLSVPGASVPVRRRLAIEAASTEIVALLEDTTLPCPGWCDAIRTAFADARVGGAGGPIQVSTSLPDRLQALGWSEYGAFHPRLYTRLAVAPTRPDGTVPVATLPGNNLAFRRSAALTVLDRCDDGLIEGATGQALRSLGFDLVLHPGMAVTYAPSDWRGGGLATRFAHGRIFGGGRASGCRWNTRLWLAARALVLPLVLSWRTLMRIRRVLSPRALPRLALWVGALETAWALGEGFGSLAGRGGSLARWS